MKFTATRGESRHRNELTVQTRQAGTCTVVDVTGRMTIDSSPHLRPVLHGAIAAAPPAGVVVDVTRVSYVDTSAIATLIEAARVGQDCGIRIRVVGLNGEPRLLADVTELDRIFRSLGSDVELT
jgi:anti-anti-sigma factor